MSPALELTKLFTPLKLGSFMLKHRVIMAPLTRTRCPEHIPTEMVAKYYEQRASDGSLLISEATLISVMAGNLIRTPGIFTPEQRRGWKRVTDAVHKKGGLIFCQLWHVGRVGHPVSLGGRKPLSSSTNKCLEGKAYFAVPNEALEFVEPQEMTLEDIRNTIEDYVHATKTAIAAGFDGVEIHCANGYLMDQFLCDNINNQRKDSYGGSVENRSRFVLEVLDAICTVVGPDRVGIRFSPWGRFQGTAPSDPILQYSHVAEQADQRGIAYIHLVEPRSDLIRGSEKKLKQLKQIAIERAGGSDPAAAPEED